MVKGGGGDVEKGFENPAYISDSLVIPTVCSLTPEAPDVCAERRFQTIRSGASSCALYLQAVQLGPHIPKSNLQVTFNVGGSYGNGRRCHPPFSVTFITAIKTGTSVAGHETCFEQLVALTKHTPGLRSAPGSGMTETAFSTCGPGL